jgi:hypothetical protein
MVVVITIVIAVAVTWRTFAARTGSSAAPTARRAELSARRRPHAERRGAPVHAKTSATKAAAKTHRRTRRTLPPQVAHFAEDFIELPFEFVKAVIDATGSAWAAHAGPWTGHWSAAVRRAAKLKAAAEFAAKAASETSASESASAETARRAISWPTIVRAAIFRTAVVALACFGAALRSAAVALMAVSIRPIAIFRPPVARARIARAARLGAAVAFVAAIALQAGPRVVVARLDSRHERIVRKGRLCGARGDTSPAERRRHGGGRKPAGKLPSAIHSESP